MEQGGWVHPSPSTPLPLAWQGSEICLAGDGSGWQGGGGTLPAGIS